MKKITELRELKQKLRVVREEAKELHKSVAAYQSYLEKIDPTASKTWLQERDEEDEIAFFELLLKKKLEKLSDYVKDACGEEIKKAGK